VTHSAILEPEHTISLGAAQHFAVREATRAGVLKLADRPGLGPGGP
jgi:hypothetical protein